MRKTEDAATTTDSERSLSSTVPTGSILKKSMRKSRSDTDLMRLGDGLDIDIAGFYPGDNSDNESVVDFGEALRGDHPPIRKNVSFGNLEELTFPVVQGDPNFEMAYPMTLGWDHCAENSFSIDAYEEQRPSQMRRCSDDLRTMSEERRKMIKDSKKAQRKRGHQRGHRQNRASIGNGEAMMGLLRMGSNSNSQGKEGKSRPGLRRQNSIGNGQISRDKRRNTVQDFIFKMGFGGSGKANFGGKAEPKKESTTSTQVSSTDWEC